jgi:replication-associated recombination protein RarA
MAAPERLNVLLTRARCLNILIGNLETFISSRNGKDIWTRFFELLKKRGDIYDGLPVKCERHPEKTALISEPADFERFCPDGGCSEPCGAVLKCGLHKCKLRCHRVADHSKSDCTQTNDKTCERGHRTKVVCGRTTEVCFKCREEDRALERQVKRDLKLEAERLERQTAYAKELQEIQDEKARQRRVMKILEEEAEEKKTLQQERDELRSLKETAARVQQQKQLRDRVEKASLLARVGNGLSSCQSQPVMEKDSLPSGANDEWQRQKTVEGARSPPIDDLMKMIGLEEVKKEFLAIKGMVDIRARQGLSMGSDRFSCSLLGNPGTGKTTVARIYAQFLTNVGVIPGSHFEETTGSKLANGGIAGCQKLMDEILNDGGGVLFIDEAYQMTSGNTPGGRAVLDYLLPEIENLTGKIVFVLAGYNKEMESFFAHNPGLPSRFPIEMMFDDYTDEELLRILELKINKRYQNRIKCEDGLRGLYCRIVARRIGRGRGRDGFGNARTVENTLAKVSKRQTVRLQNERRAGVKSDEMLFTKQDLIGPEPSEALASCDAWRKLQNLIGLASVKQAVKVLVDSIQQNYNQELIEAPLIEYSLNKVFLGNPGTGKTTVAKLYGAILVHLGLLSKGEVIVKNPADFVGAHLGQSEQTTKGILAATEGKVLVIDEAYGLYCGNGTQGSTNDPYKTAVIDTIVAEIQSVPGEDRCVLLLGYREQMEAMFQNVNPGLSRRFPITSAFSFEDFDNDELRDILELKLGQQGFRATGQAKSVATEILGRERNRPKFGNAGQVDILLDATKARYQMRVKPGNKKDANLLIAQDFDENFDRAERSETNVKQLFNGTIGCEDTIALLEGYQETVRTMKSMEVDPKESIPFNFLFRGPPGTGKTATARKMGKVFYDMGFLATADVLECSVADLVGQYVGQTGPKVQKLLESALGKVLFIDEAYRLGDGPFAKEAVDELVDCVTKPKFEKKLVIILAGYESDINRLMQINEGLTSRFPEVINFRGLSPGECVELIRVRLGVRKIELATKGLELDLGVLELPTEGFAGKLKNKFATLASQASWASARDVRKLAEDVFKSAAKAAIPVDGNRPRRILVDERLVLAELDAMLIERKSRSQRVQSDGAPNSYGHSMIDPLSMRQPPPPSKAAPTRTSVSSSIQRAKENLSEEEEPTCHAEQRAPVASAVTKPRRDVGVSDEVWDQLQRDTEAEKAREEDYQQLLKARDKARDGEREKIIKRLLEEERRRQLEAEMKRKLAAMGKCPVGFEWIKQADGYRCAGGSHFISKTQMATF